MINPTNAATLAGRFLASAAILVAAWHFTRSYQPRTQLAGSFARDIELVAAFLFLVACLAVALLGVWQ